jgi:cyclin-dependent kinase-like
MIHRDVKPENLLIDDQLNLKLCDFGFARKIKLNEENNNVDTMTDYVATRWYRSPELLLSGGIYGPEVDYWAIGCIMGELADGNPMFPGENEVDQLDCIIKILGNLPENLVNMYYENPIYNVKTLFKVKKPETLERRYFGILSPTAIDFMKGLLEMDPNKRLNGETVFKHKYFSIFMNNNEEKSKTITNNVNEIKEIKMKTIKKNLINNNNSNTKEIVDIIKKNENNNCSEINNRNYNTTNNSNTIPKILNLIKIKGKKENEQKYSTIPSKVINNTTNINIINYNCYNNSPNINDFPIQKKILDMNNIQKNQMKNILNNDISISK